ncbi:MAG: hypothetical protein ACKOWF_17605 [Chloroflexota bacterium]
MTANPPSPRNPEEQMSIVRDIGRELGEIFVQYVQGQLDFAEVTFAAYDALQDVHVVVNGEYELIAGDLDDDEDDDEGYDDEDHLREQEDLSGEPSR